MERRTYRSIKPFLAGPFIWMMAIPLLILDVFIEIYHHICFPLYEIPLIQRSKYVKIDRQKLEYLTPVQKVECVFCGYANGLLQYAVEIAGQSEKYWCGIKHKETEGFVPPEHHADFVEYDDKTAFEKRYPEAQEAGRRNIWQTLRKFFDNHSTWRQHHP